MAPKNKILISLIIDNIIEEEHILDQSNDREHIRLLYDVIKEDWEEEKRLLAEALGLTMGWPEVEDKSDSTETIP